MSKILMIKEAAEKAITAESVRAVQLVRKAEIFAAGILLVTGFQLLDVKTLLESSQPWVRISCYASLFVLGVSLFFGVRAMRLKGYADYPRGNKLWDNLKPETVTEEAAQEAIILQILSARETNAQLNDAKVKSLFRCGWLFFVGFLLVAGGQFLDAFTDTMAS